MSYNYKSLIEIIDEILNSEKNNEFFLYRTRCERFIQLSEINQIEPEIVEDISAFKKLFEKHLEYMSSINKDDLNIYLKKIKGKILAI